MTRRMEIRLPASMGARAEWAKYYLVDPPATIFESVEREQAYYRIRRELQQEVRRDGHVLLDKEGCP